MKKNTYLDYLLLGEIMIIGLAEVAHLGALLLGWPFGWCAMLFWGLVGGMCVLIAFFLLVKGIAFAKVNNKQRPERKQILPGDVLGWGLMVLFAALFISQVLFVCIGNGRYRQGDMTVETVGSFLATDRIYQVNPMTGQPYMVGLPTRLKILCLPTLYGSLCRIFGLSPTIVVWEIMPVVTLCSCYVAFASLGCCLFSVNCPDCDAESPSVAEEVRGAWKKRLCFLVVVSLLIWVGTYLYGMDGFDILYCGWKGVAIRNGVLLPWLLSLCLRRKWLLAFLCILAEACLVWTFYGMGACLVVVIGMAVSGAVTRKLPKLKSDVGADRD